MEKLKFVALQSIVEPGFWNRMTKGRDLTVSYRLHVLNSCIGFFTWNQYLSYKVKNMPVSRSKPAVTKAFDLAIWRRSESKYTSGASHIKVISFKLNFNLRELTKTHFNPNIRYSSASLLSGGFLIFFHSWFQTLYLKKTKKLFRKYLV